MVEFIGLASLLCYGNAKGTIKEQCWRLRGKSMTNVRNCHRIGGPSSFAHSSKT